MTLTAAVETYFADLGRVRASGGATGERSSYGPLANLFNAIGATLTPKVFWALLHEYPLRVGRRGPHFSRPSAGATLRG